MPKFHPHLNSATIAKAFCFLCSSFRLGFCFTLLIRCCWFFYIFILPNKSFIFLILFYFLYFVIVLSFWLVSHFFFSLFCWGLILLCCSCFNYSFIFPNIYFILLIYFVFYCLILYCYFFSFFLFLNLLLDFLTTPWSLQDLGSQIRGWTWAPVVGALSPNHWTKREPHPQEILNGVRPPGGPHLSTKTRLYRNAWKLQCWTSQENNQ